VCLQLPSSAARDANGEKKLADEPALHLCFGCLILLDSFGVLHLPAMRRPTATSGRTTFHHHHHRQHVFLVIEEKMLKMSKNS
jgi:hypothetical protein